MEICDGKIRVMVMGFYFLFSGAEAVGVLVTMTLMMTPMDNWVAVILCLEIFQPVQLNAKMFFCFYILFSHLTSFSFLYLIFHSI